MHRIWLRILVVALAFTVSTLVVKVSQSIFHRDQPAITSKQSLLSTPAGAQQKFDFIDSSHCTLKFIPTLRACMPGWAQLYEVSDNEQLSEWSQPEKSTAEAQNELNTYLKEATAVNPAQSIIDKRGRIVSRIVAKFPANQVWPKGYISVLWIEDNNLRGINAPTLRHILEFEICRERP